ncbi:hypothetical protein [Desmospora activa]|uniref:Uncharacterized protein n=1 Tax=Desmospora activa DSM 45169 TaxID=1121389 RepID=A0A2T4Z8M4_9BACL|nr:hypothetical protein [Desmospora activa]PTM58205.1 hypothetical protein C8J48_0783 [Desmospora activa DSM 45169]
MDATVDTVKIKRYYQSQTQQTIEKLIALFSYPFHSDTDQIDFEVHYGPTANTYSIQVFPMEKMTASQVFENAYGKLIGSNLDYFEKIIFCGKDDPEAKSGEGWRKAEELLYIFASEKTLALAMGMRASVRRGRGVFLPLSQA